VNVMGKNTEEIDWLEKLKRRAEKSKDIRGIWEQTWIAVRKGHEAVIETQKDCLDGRWIAEVAVCGRQIEQLQADLEAAKQDIDNRDTEVGDLLIEKAKLEMELSAAKQENIKLAEVNMIAIKKLEQELSAAREQLENDSRLLKERLTTIDELRKANDALEERFVKAVRETVVREEEQIHRAGFLEACDEIEKWTTWTFKSEECASCRGGELYQNELKDKLAQMRKEKEEAK